MRAACRAMRFHHAQMTRAITECWRKEMLLCEEHSKSSTPVGFQRIHGHLLSVPRIPANPCPNAALELLRASKHDGVVDATDLNMASPA